MKLKFKVTLYKHEYVLQQKKISFKVKIYLQII